MCFHKSQVPFKTGELLIGSLPELGKVHTVKSFASPQLTFCTAELLGQMLSLHNACGNHSFPWKERKMTVIGP